MCSVRSNSERHPASRRCTKPALLALGALLAGAGCAARTPPKPDQVTDATLKPDPAMEQQARHPPREGWAYGSHGSTPPTNEMRAQVVFRVGASSEQHSSYLPL